MFARPGCFLKKPIYIFADLDMSRSPRPLNWVTESPSRARILETGALARGGPHGAAPGAPMGDSPRMTHGCLTDRLGYPRYRPEAKVRQFWSSSNDTQLYVVEGTHSLHRCNESSDRIAQEGRKRVPAKTTSTNLSCSACGSLHSPQASTTTYAPKVRCDMPPCFFVPIARCFLFFPRNFTQPLGNRHDVFKWEWYSYD